MWEMYNVKKFLSRSVLVVLFFSVLTLACVAPFGVVHASTNVGGVIGADTTWTKTNSPYSLTGNLLVHHGVTLTIEAGVSINLGDYYIMVNGTLVAIGSDTDPVHFTATSSDFSECRNITFTQFSTGWNEQTGSGSILDNVSLEKVNIVSSVPLKMVNSFSGECYALIECDSLIFLNNHISFGHVNVGASSIVRGNDLKAVSITGSTNALTNNAINSLHLYDCSLQLSNNNINSLYLYDCSLQISNNTISGMHLYGGSLNLSNNKLGNIEGSADSLIISDNTIRRIGTYDSSSPDESTHLNADSATISNNKIEHYVYLSGDSIILNNTITGYFGSYTYTVFVPARITETRTYRTDALNLKGSAYVAGNTISEGKVGISGGTTIEGNLLFNNENGIVMSGNNVTIRNNHITANNTGISGSSDGTATIENNWISSGSCGIDISSAATIQNNTISSTGIAVRLENCPLATINYNNFENYGENSIYLVGSSTNIDATYNWWGTADTQTINLTIYDSKYSFDLGEVVFVPFLPEANPKAIPTVTFEISDVPEIPEFPSWVVLPALLALVLIATVFRRRLVTRIEP